jgi:Tfp pilus assembly protein PilN
LEQQNDNINSLEKSLKNQDKQISEMEKLQSRKRERSFGLQRSAKSK